MGSFHSRFISPPRHRSIRSVSPANFRITNDTKYTISLDWVDYSGEVNSYGYVMPGETRYRSTWETHPWQFSVHKSKDGTTGAKADDGGPIFVCADTRRAVVYPRAEELHELRVVEAERLEWTPDTRVPEFQGYKPAARAFLICHHRLTSPRGTSYKRRVVARSRRAPEHANGARGDAASQPLPPELLRAILALAAPVVLGIDRPYLPDGALAGDYTRRELKHLFKM
jgi:hypothetical protein